MNFLSCSGVPFSAFSAEDAGKKESQKSSNPTSIADPKATPAGNFPLDATERKGIVSLSFCASAGQPPADTNGGMELGIFGCKFWGLEPRPGTLIHVFIVFLDGYAGLICLCFVRFGFLPTKDQARSASSTCLLLNSAQCRLVDTAFTRAGHISAVG